jgi:tellurite resistance protein TerC
MQVTVAWWVGTLTAIGLLLMVDLAISRRLGQQTTRQSARWVAFYVAAALIFGLVISLSFGVTYGGQFVAGWLTEYSLSIDNLFIFYVIMARFAVPRNSQHKVLLIGIVLALILRGFFIAVGAAAIARFEWIFFIFGAFLIWTAMGLVRSKQEFKENPLLRWARRVLQTSDGYDGARIVTHQDGRRLLTPLFLVMIAIGTTDLLFALDSIPAVFGVTDEAYLVFVANAFALLGLRALFFLVKGLLDRLVYLSVGLSVILAFIGVKLALHWAHSDLSHAVPEIGTPVSLAVIVVVLAVTTVASLLRTRKGPGTGKDPDAGKDLDAGKDPDTRKDPDTQGARV